MMSREDNPQSHPNFDAPIEVVTDPSLSKQDKAEALEDLEQDARQLDIASSEGMSGDGRRRSQKCSMRKRRWSHSLRISPMSWS
jgi:hypothetical protein